MIRNIIKIQSPATFRINKKFGSATIFAQEKISINNPSQFPPENGVVKNSAYTSTITIPMSTLDQYIWIDLNKYRNKTAIECGITGRSYTYDKLRDHCASFAVNLLTKIKLERGDTVAVCLPNIPEFPIVGLGAIEAGLLVTPMNPIYKSEEIARQLASSNAKVLVGTVENHEMLTKAIELSKTDIKLILIKTHNDQMLPESAIDFFELINTNGSYDILKNRKFDTNDTILLPYSSGTTGLPKGVELTHRNIISNCEMMRQNIGNDTMAHETTETFQEVMPCVLPYFHIYGWTVNLMSKLKLGCKLVTLPSFTPNTFVNVLLHHKATILNLVPPIVIFLSASTDITTECFKSLRLILSGSAPLGASDVERFLQKAPQVKFCQGYGLTETSPMTLIQEIGNMVRCQGVDRSK